MFTRGDVLYWLKRNYGMNSRQLLTKEQEEELNEINIYSPESIRKLNTNEPKDLSFGIKEPLSLVPPVLIRKVSRCMEDGAKKRSPYNWRDSKVSARQLLDKILRHTLDCLDGKDLTEDSKLSNLASAAADIAVYLDAEECGTLVDDRPKRK